MRAVVVDPEAVSRLSVAEVEEPEPVPPEALVRISAVSLNRGEVRRAEASEPGFRPGWDLAGTVERAAADGSGPQEGPRVGGFLPSPARGPSSPLSRRTRWPNCPRVSPSRRLRLMVGPEQEDELRDYERPPESGEVFIYVAMSRLMVGRLAPS